MAGERNESRPRVQKTPPALRRPAESEGATKAQALGSIVKWRITSTYGIVQYGGRFVSLARVIFFLGSRTGSWPETNRPHPMNLLPGTSRYLQYDRGRSGAPDNTGRREADALDSEPRTSSTPYLYIGRTYKKQPVQPPIGPVRSNILARTTGQSDPSRGPIPVTPHRPCRNPTLPRPTKKMWRGSNMYTGRSCK